MGEQEWDGNLLGNLIRNFGANQADRAKPELGLDTVHISCVYAPVNHVQHVSVKH